MQVSKLTDSQIKELTVSIEDQYTAKKCVYPIYRKNKDSFMVPLEWGISNNFIPNTTFNDNKIKIKDSSIKLRPIQKECIEECNKQFIKEHGGGIINLSTSLGKCHGVDTPILMFDGTIKKVQDVQVGELLMGDDSTPRKVLSLARGQDTMYDIIPVKGEKYTVNQEHILCLKISEKAKVIKTKHGSFEVMWYLNNKRNLKTFKEEYEAINIEQQDAVEITVKDYIKLPKYYRHVLKGYKASIEFSEKQIDLDPYMIGFWLGDGNSKQSEFTSQDSTINGDGTGYSNHFMNTLKKYNLIGNKHIPMDYKCNSTENRLKLLAGLLDSDGYLCNDKSCFEFVQNSEKLIDDTIYLARSLGFSCYKSKQKKDRIVISGNTEKIPTLCPRKKANKRRRMVDVLRTGITVKEVGFDNYYGFEIDGNRRYLMGDFTVTHNTVLSLYLIGKYKYRTLILVNTIELIEQWTKEIKKFLPDATIGKIRGNEFDVNKDIVLATVQTISKKYHKEAFNIFSMVFIDEVHHLSSKVFNEALYKTRVKYTFGLSATIERKDKLEYIFKWHLGDVIFSNLDKTKQDTDFVKINYTVQKKEITIYNGKPNISAMITELSEDPTRTKIITDYLIQLIKKESKRRVLVLSDRVFHLHTLHSILGPEISGLYTGKTSEIEKADSKNKSILLATYQIASEGFNHPVLNTLLFATPRSNISQSIGRIYRKAHDIKPMIIDVIDSHSIFPYQYRKRTLVYKKELNFIKESNQEEQCLFD